VGSIIGSLQIWMTLDCLAEEGQPRLFSCVGITGEPEYVEDKSILLIESENSTISVYVEVANDLQERRSGLMFRQNMDWNSGMFFVFDNEKGLSFWMKNTLIPLDMLFIDDDFKIVDIKEIVSPCLEDICPNYISEYPAKYVLEVNAGFTKENNIKIGDNILWNASDTVYHAKLDNFLNGLFIN